MSELQERTNVLEQGIGRFLEQYKDKTDINKLAAIYLDGVQELEAATWQVVIKRFLANATAVQLNDIGAIVGESRQARSDDDYRIWISVRIRLNRSFGRPQDVIDCVKLATDADFRFQEYAGGAFVVNFLEQPANGNDIAAIVHLAKGAGIDATVMIPPETGGFRFKNNDEASDPDHGFVDGSTI